MPAKAFLKRNWPLILSGLGWFYYLLVTITFFNYITILMLGALTVGAPTLLLSFRGRHRPHRRRVLRRRLLITGFIFGLLSFAMFPNVVRIPTQVYRRLNRIETTVTPDNPTVVAFREAFLNECGGEAFVRSQPLRRQLNWLDGYTQREIDWTEDFVTVGMAGDVRTPEEAIRAGRDDCRGQACVMASVLIGMGHDAWVCEQPWHWWVMVYADNGTGLELNRDGSKNRTAPQQLMMMWNDAEVRVVEDPLSLYAGLMNTSSYFYGYLGDLSFGVVAFPLLLAAGLAGYTTVCQGDYRPWRAGDAKARRRFKKRFWYGTAACAALLVVLGLLYLTPARAFIGFYLFVYGMTAIVTVFNLEEVNAKFA